MPRRTLYRWVPGTPVRPVRATRWRSGRSPGRLRSVRCVLDLLLPRRCTLCGLNGTGLCGACLATLPAAPDLAAPPGYEACWSLLRYEGATTELVAALKYRGHRDAVALLGAAMADLLDDPTSAQVESVTWAPTSPQRRR